MIRSIIIVLVAALLVLTGCGGKSSGGAAAPRTTTVTKEQAVEAAKAAVAEHDSFAKTATYDAEERGNGWVVTVAAGKQARMIIIDAEGKVVKYEGGG